MSYEGTSVMETAFSVGHNHVGDYSLSFALGMSGVIGCKRKQINDDLSYPLGKMSSASIVFMIYWFQKVCGLSM